MRALRLLVVSALAVLLAGSAHAGITIVNTDGPGEGFNDPTPAAPVGGNPGTTVGQQRLNVFNKAGQIWSAILQSPVEIRVQASFDPLFCTATSAVLGSAGPNTVESDFAGATFPGTWYVTAEANRLTGTDLEPGQDDIVAQFNSDIGGATCLSGRSWYYGYDGNEGATGIDLLPVLLHEFGHGLGFLTVTDETNGAYLGGQPCIFDRYLKDDVSGKHWYQMTAAERVASAINTTHLVWDGPAVTAGAPQRLGARPVVTTTGAITGQFVSGTGIWGAPLTTTGVTGDLVLAVDGAAPTGDACSALTNAAAVAGKIAVIDVGTCTLQSKAAVAQAAGAIGVVLVNNVAGPSPQIRGTATGITIPVTSVSQTDGAAIKAAMGSGVVHATLGLDPAHLAGANNAGLVQMFAPNPDQPGSSVSHWDVAAFPNLLMEPSINPDLGQNVDLTYQAFFDMGWFPQLVSVDAPASGDLAFASAPNPARTAGTLRFRLPAPARVELAVFDAAGRRVVKLASRAFEAGDHAVAWDRRDDAGRRVGPGVYLARLKAGSVERTLHLVLVD